MMQPQFYFPAFLPIFPHFIRHPVSILRHFDLALPFQLVSAILLELVQVEPEVLKQ